MSELGTYMGYNINATAFMTDRQAQIERAVRFAEQEQEQERKNR